MTLWHKFLRGIALAGVFFVTGTGAGLANHAVRVSDLDAAAFVVHCNDVALREDSVVRLSPPLLSKSVKLKNYRVYETSLLGIEEKGRLFLNINESGALSSIVLKSEKESVGRSLALRRVLALSLESLGMTEAERAEFFSSEEKSPNGGGALRHAWCEAQDHRFLRCRSCARHPRALRLGRMTTGQGG